MRRWQAPRGWAVLVATVAAVSAAAQDDAGRHVHPAGHDHPLHDHPMHDHPMHTHPVHDHPGHDVPGHDHPGQSHGQTGVAGAETDYAHDGHADEHAAHVVDTLHGEQRPGLLGEGTEFLWFDVPLFVWTLLMFLPLHLVLKSLVWKPVLSTMQEREGQIANSLKQAELVRAEAEALLASHEKQMAASHAEARKLLDDARAEAAAEGSRILQDARATAAADQAAAQTRIEQAKQESLEAIAARTQAVGRNMASKLVGRDVAAAGGSA